MQGKFHWSNFYKRAEFLGISAYAALALLCSILRPFSIKQHLFLLVFIIFLFYSQKIKGYVPIYFVKYLKVQLGGTIRRSQKYNKPS